MSSKKSQNPMTVARPRKITIFKFLAMDRNNPIIAVTEPDKIINNAIKDQMKIFVENFPS
jgi:hypothetical protein